MHYKADDLHLGLVYLACAFYENRLLDKALPIFEKCDYKQGLAEVYYRIGKRYDTDPDLSKICINTYRHITIHKPIHKYAQIYTNNHSCKHSSTHIKIYKKSKH